MTEVTPLVIVTHPLRTAMATELAMRVQPVLGLQTDLRQQGCMANHAKAYEWLLKHTTRHPAPWVCVLEDDAVPCVNFHDQLRQVLAVAPTPFVSLYLGRGRPPHWQHPISTVIMPHDQDPNFLTTPNMLHTVGMAIHTDILPEMLAWVLLCMRELPESEIDCVLSHFSGQYGHTVAYTRPSLVNHADTPSLIPTELRMDQQPRAEKRVAWLHDGRESWNNSHLEIPLPHQVSMR